jgi:hypothetical protein
LLSRPALTAWGRPILALVAVLFIGFETRGRTIDQIDSALTGTPTESFPVGARLG